MTFFYDLNKKLAGISEQPAGKQQVNEGLSELSRSIAGAAKKIGPVAKKVGGAVQKAGGAVLNKVGHGSDADMIRDLQRKMGVAQTGEKPGQPPVQQVKEKLSPAKAKNFAALAEPKDKITFADKIAGAKKEVDEVLGDVAANAIKKAIGGHSGREEMESTGDYSAKKGAAGKDLGKPGKNFGKIAAKSGGGEKGKRIAGAVLNKLRHKGAAEGEMDEGWDDMERDVKGRMGQMKTGEKVQGHKGEIEKTSTGIRHTRRYDNKTGVTDTGDETPAAGEKRGRGRPKSASKAPERVTANATKHKGGRKVAKEGDFGPMEEGADEGMDMVKLAKVIASCTTQAQLDTARRMAQNFLKKHQTGDLAFYGSDMKRGNAVAKDIANKRDEIGEEELDEKAVSKKQQKFMGMVHATQKGEKAPSKEVAKVAKTMKKSDAKDFASTKQKGLPEKAPKKKEEDSKEDKPKKVKEEGGAGTPTASSGFSFGKGIYDSMNFELEQMIAESMSINMSDSTEGGKSLTVTATDDDALQLAELLNNAGMQGGGEMGMDHEAGACPSCGEAPCGCDDEVEVEVDENQPNWPTNTETSNDAVQYSGGLNKPKTDVAGDGQTTVPVTAAHTEEEEILRKLREAAGITKVAEQEQVVAIEEDEEELDESFEQTLDRMRGIAGIKEAKKAGKDYDGDGKVETGAEEHAGSVDKAIKKAQAEKKVDESIFALTNQWKAYKG